MTTAALPPDDDPKLLTDDDTLPPEHPAGSDSTVSAGEVLSGEGLGAAATPGAREGAAGADHVPGDDS
jgi:hypothetical protein